MPKLLSINLGGWKVFEQSYGPRGAVRRSRAVSDVVGSATNLMARRMRRRVADIIKSLRWHQDLRNEHNTPISAVAGLHYKKKAVGRLSAYTVWWEQENVFQVNPKILEYGARPHLMRDTSRTIINSRGKEVNPIYARHPGVANPPMPFANGFAMFMAQDYYNILTEANQAIAEICRARDFRNKAWKKAMKEGADEF
jgi:hypothetical protein